MVEKDKAHSTPMLDPFDIVRISMLPNIGPNRGRSLLSRFGSFEKLQHAPAKELAELDGFEKTLATKTKLALHDEKLLATIHRTVEKCEKTCREKSIHLITYLDDAYPKRLHQIYDPPLYFFMRGDIVEKDSRSLAIVGTRSATPYGKHCVEKLCGDLADLGVTIISGLALGVDSIAHHTALMHGARTIAVLGSGVENIYPDQNRKLAEKITTQGAVISELPLQAKPDAVNFPRRNRIISGIALGVLVVETDVKGGSIITAHLAADQNRPVFAVPGNIFDRSSAGTNNLIKTNIAKLVQRVDDILEELPELAGKKIKHPTVQLTMFEEQIVRHLSQEPIQIDELALLTELSTSDLLVQLLQLEFKGVVRQLPGKMFVQYWE